jgi:ABC-type uncharacterized transport system involved in gliding motility auxiliary subunit
MTSEPNFLGKAGQVFGRRQVRFGFNATVMTLALLAILVLLNVLATRNHVRWDLTAEGAFSLSPQSIDIIQNLEQPVEIIGFYNAEQLPQQEELASRLQEYTSRSELISYRFIDPDVQPVAAQNYNITSYGTVVVESGERRQQLTGLTDEQAITGAMLTVTRETQPTAYFLSGHGERSLQNAEQQGYAQVQSVLQEDNIQVEEISLVLTDTIPLTNSVLIVADPQSELQEQEAAIISTYVANGGRLMLLSNPLSPPPLSAVMEAAGLAWADDLLLDSQSELGNPTAPAVVDYSPHPVTDGLNGPTLYPTVRTIIEQEAPAGLSLTPLLNSSLDSVAATDFGADGTIQPNPDDRQGPLPFGYGIEGSGGAQAASAGIGSGARLVIIGDADFASNAYLNVPGTANRDFFRSAVSWLVAQEDTFVLPPAPQPVDRSVFLTDSQSQLIFYGTTLGLPLLVIIAGVVVWWQRR